MNILRIITAMSENLPRFKIYQGLQSDPLLQVFLLQIFSEVVEFSVMANYFSQNSLGKFELFWLLTIWLTIWLIEGI